MASQLKPYYTPEEYLALERAAEYRSEYLDGEIFAMSGASEAHNTIAMNIVRHLGNQFEGRPCRVFASDMRVRVTPGRMYTYPDVVAVCGPRQFAEDQRDTLLNPTVVFEVLSPSTEAYDRGAKLAHYWRLASLTDYVLVAQDRMRVEHFARQGDGWFVTAAESPDETLRLAALDAELVLRAIYTNVEFPAPEPESPDPQPLTPHPQ
jgi:Uma2 family endonuclease